MTINKFLLLALLLTSCSPLSVMAIQAPSITASPTATKRPQGDKVNPTPTPFHVYIVAVDVLEVRTGPTETAPNVGYLTRGDIVAIYATAQADEYCKTWAKIAPAESRWVCFEKLTKG